MKHKIRIFGFLIFFTSCVTTSPRWYGYLSSQNNGPVLRQIGKLEIIKSNSLLYYRTDSTELQFKPTNYRDSIDWNDHFNTYQGKKKTCETIATLLFSNGLLTGDLLLRAQMFDEKRDKKSKYQYFGFQSLDLYNIILYNPKKNPNTNFLKFTINILAPEGMQYVDFENRISIFSLIVKSESKSDEVDLSVFLKNAHVYKLSYCGIQI
jgi:hypothetical protein